MTDEIVNRVAKSSLQQVDLDAWMPKDDEIVALDMNLFLVDNILFMEKHFRESVEKHDFTVYNDKYVYVTNHVEAIVPLWAYMILSTKLKNARWSGFANSDSVHNAIIEHIILNKDLSEYKGKPVIVKGCGKYAFSPNVYMLVTKRLMTVAKSVMYGEACSSVPVYKQVKK
tara:strand:- start:207 stop:719 length:513 start_codon:yes stop_codon:yes gene_type:complete